jgi:hypothetical protein
MMKLKQAVSALAVVAAAIASPALAQSYDANPTVGFTYGTGNNYTPANAVVLTTADPFGSRTSPPLAELALRAHVPFLPAAATGGTGIYTFNIGSAVSFDFSAFGTALPNAQITVTNVGTGDNASFAASLLGTVQANGALQGSQQLGFGFLNGNPLPSEDINFNNQIDSTYRIDLSGGGQTVTAFAQIGAGAVAAVPEPATWAMMIGGFGAIGASMRRRKVAVRFA